MGKFAGILQYLGVFGIGGILDLVTEAGEEFYNDTGGTLTKGTLVYKSGFHAGTSRPKVTKASATTADSGARYVVLETVANNARGLIGRRAYLGGLNTNGATVGDAVYAGATGAISLSATGFGQRVGRVGTVSATNGFVHFDIEDAPGAGSTSFMDSVFRIFDNAAPTKKMAFEVSSVTAGQTRTVTMPDTNVDLGTIATHTSQIAALSAENVDVIIPVSHGIFTAVSGTWTRARTAAATYRLQRTAAAAAQAVAIEVPVSRLRTATDKGLKVTGAKIKYTLTTEVADDVTVSGAYSVVPATGAAVAAATSLGAVTYDAAHDTAGERGAIGEHTLTLTFGSPAYLADGFIEILITVNDTTGGLAVFDLFQLELVCAETLVEAA